MIRVCINMENMGPGGPIHHVKNIAKYIDRSRFEVFLSTCAQPFRQYATSIFPLFGEDHVFIYDYEEEAQQWNAGEGKFPDAPDDHPLYRFLKEKRIDILHDQRSGEIQFPLNSPKITCKKMDTNIFGGYDPHLDMSLPISQGTYNTRLSYMSTPNPYSMPKAAVIPLSTDFSYSKANLRHELGIPEDAFVFGRSSNGWAPDRMNLEACSRIDKDNVYFIGSSLSPGHRQFAAEVSLKHFIPMPTICSYDRMSMYYNTMDVLAHDRAESFGCAVAEAMMHGLPVISRGWSHGHFNDTNAQEELFPDGTYCAQGNSHESYLNDYIRLMRLFIESGKEFCKEVGHIFMLEILKKSAAPDVIKKLERYYEEVMNARIC